MAEFDLNRFLVAQERDYATAPDFVTFLKSECNYLIIRCNYFCLGDALRNE